LAFDIQPFLSWAHGDISKMWLHGIPGARKTIVCSTVIEYVHSLCQNGDEYAYFYFDFSDPKKQVMGGFIKSMIIQLCARKDQVPEIVGNLYQECDHGTQKPGRKRLQ